MKSLCLLASIFPLFGCSNDDTTLEKGATQKPQFLQVEKQKISNETNQMLVKKYNNEPTGNPKINSNPIVTRKPSAILNVPVVNQNPELKYGCEVTSLTMVLKYAGVQTNKMELYRSIQKETDPLIQARNGDILHWGNPEYGFVGDMTGKRAGTTVFEKPIIALINQKLPGRALSLSKRPFEQILNHVAEGYPVVVWTTLDYGLPRRWETWRHGHQIVRVPLDLHAVVLVGYDANSVFLNDPLTARKQVRVGKQRFISSWKALGSRAVSYR